MHTIFFFFYFEFANKYVIVENSPAKVCLQKKNACKCGDLLVTQAKAISHLLANQIWSGFKQLAGSRS